MNDSSLTGKIYSILKNEPQVRVAESVSNYLHYQSEKITPDLLQMVWDKASDGMLLTDSDGITVAVNDAFCAMVKMEESELTNLPFTVIYDSTIDRKKLFDTYRNNVQLGKFVEKREECIPLSSGTEIVVEVLTTLLTDEAQERFVLTEFRDISERKRWERFTQESENRYRTWFENSVLPMYQSNIDGKFINANISLLKLLGYESFDELLALDLERDVYVNPEQRVALYMNLQADEHAKPSELELKRKDGSTIIVLAHSRIIRDGDNSISGFEGALEDITERKSLEQKLQMNIAMLETAQDELTKSNTQKDKILAIVSHDLRSPFSSILGFCELLTSEFHSLTDKEKLEYVGFINEAAKQQLNLVNSMLDWSRLETGRIRLKLQQTAVGKLASEVITSLMGIAKRNNVNVRSSIPLTTSITADEQLIRQLLSNLIGNALKFTPAGGSITLDIAEDTSSQTVISLTDTGVGIPQQDLGKLFKMEEKYTRQGLQGEIGTGLGLPMCHEIMKKHHGEITANSTEGKGTVFTLTFRKEIKSTCKKVMIVDDQKGNRLILSRFMKRIAEDSEAMFAETGKEALDMMALEQPDIVMTDYHMPTMDGLEFIRRMRNDEKLKNIPVILISGDNMEYYVENDMLTKVLKKPVMFNDLKEVMDKIIF